MRSLVVLLTLAVAATTNCAEIASRDLVADSEIAALPADGVSQRDDKCKFAARGRHIWSMVFILDGCSFHYAHKWSKSGISIF